LHLAHPVGEIRLRWLIALLIALRIALLIAIALLRVEGILAAGTHLRIGTDSLTTIGAAYHEHPHFRTRDIRRRPEGEFRSQHAGDHVQERRR
jgi:hypothetical protein